MAGRTPMSERNAHGETHPQRCRRLRVFCTAVDVTFGGRCLSCGFTPDTFKATLMAPRLDTRDSIATHNAARAAYRGQQ